MITINDKEYQDEDLTPEQIHLANQALNCQAQAKQMEAQAQVFRVAEKGFSDALIASVGEA